LHCEGDDEDPPLLKGIFLPPILLTHSIVSKDALSVKLVPESYNPLEGDTDEYCRFAGFVVIET
jgi:hypothetical protein